MIVSWNWLQDYVKVAVSPAEMARRWMLAGLNHEGTTEVGGDLAIDLEVTSNRPDCLGHLGIAREAAVLLAEPMCLPAPAPPERGAPLHSQARLLVECPDLCPRYTARLLRGVKVAPSPAWLVRRLATVGIATVNNVVDVTNYVLMECGQPLHAFDFAALAGGQIVVRKSRPGETIEAIDHRIYSLPAETCVIADANRAVGIAGVMGGAATEVAASTQSLLIEAAEFDPTSIRHTARRLNLHSDSSFRFERTIDPAAIDWASRRCCELILDLAGGELAAGVLECGAPAMARRPIVLRWSQLPRILGIEIPCDRVEQILFSLGCQPIQRDERQVEVRPPSWRRDLEREIDLVEEVARIHGYEAIPEDVRVPMAPSARRPVDILHEKVRRVLTAAGFDEAMTASVVDQDFSEAMSPWTRQPPLVSQAPILRGADRLRRSLLPSLLAARRGNHAAGNDVAELFEVAHAYLPRAGGLPEEALLLGLVSGQNAHGLKGVVETLAGELLYADGLTARAWSDGMGSQWLEEAVEMLLDEQPIAIVGQLNAAGLKRFELRAGTSVAEVRLTPLFERAVLIPQYRRLPPFPAVERDLNLVVDERVLWADLQAVVQSAAGPLLEALIYRDTYRHAEQLGAGKKSFLLGMRFRDPQATLTGGAVDELCERVLAACRDRLAASLRA